MQAGDEAEVERILTTVETAVPGSRSLIIAAVDEALAASHKVHTVPGRLCSHQLIEESGFL